MNIHLSAGLALLLLTMIRLVISRPPLLALNPWIGINEQRTRLIQFALLLIVLTTTLLGLLIYQSSALGRQNYLFGTIVMPTIIRLDHAIHGKIILAHIAFSLALLCVVVVHIAAGMRSDKITGRARISYMLWPW